ncbi:hypothetical protein FVEG_00194 [Fusarium verticillioides 7600]|uniref:Uncharacterized protein n=1 Tax=Gibberella moniliformis (strain M3125 / FGSC 7600) TaxID=334819 RepID=W7LKF2_GIBM7|nr:hypothetical protein FVEG_00194 [Fusarium verticillioides 7600]EWG36025.1 hypothetical protein FVEG_00194 [Fusarium verticillioides 7600]
MDKDKAASLFGVHDYVGGKSEHGLSQSDMREAPVSDDVYHEKGLRFDMETRESLRRERLHGYHEVYAKEAILESNEDQTGPSIWDTRDGRQFVGSFLEPVSRRATKGKKAYIRRKLGLGRRWSWLSGQLACLAAHLVTA